MREMLLPTGGVKYKEGKEGSIEIKGCSSIDRNLQVDPNFSIAEVACFWLVAGATAILDGGWV